MRYDDGARVISGQAVRRPQRTGGWSDLVIGETISHYRILTKLGEGGMGVVYKAEDMTLKRTVALKFLPPEMTRDAAARERFVREAQAAAALSHPGICIVHEVGETEGQSFIAMECVEGRSLRDELESGPVEPDRALDIAIQIAEALAEAHGKGVIHRDIKPANVMVTPGGRAKVMDFGLARLAGTTLLTRTGTTLGTVAYMSPEQVRGELADHHVDIWSLAVVLYEMVSGQRPFTGERPQAVMYSILHDEPPLLSSLTADVPAGLEGLVAKALAKRAKDRYQSADELLADLRALARGDEVTVTVPVGSRRFGGARLAKQWRTWVMVAGVAAVALTVGQRLRIRSATEEGGGIPRVLVSIFENQTGDPSHDPIGRLAAERISEGLTRTEIVEVVPTITTLPTVGGSEEQWDDARRQAVLLGVAREANADFVIAGAYRLRADSLVFRANICDVSENSAVCVLQTAAVAWENPRGAVEELRSRVMGGVAINVEPPSHGYDKSRPPLYEAYRAYMDAMVAMASPDQEDLIEPCVRAVAIDSTFLAPQFALSYWWPPARADSLMQFLDSRREEWCRLEQLWIDYRLDALRGNNTDAIWTLRRLREMDPDNAGLVMEGARVAAGVNRPREAIQLFLEWDPAAMPGEIFVFGERFRLTELAELYHRLGEDERSLESARSAIEIFPEDVDARINEVVALASLGRTEKLEAAIETWFAMWSQGWARSGRLAWALEELRRHGYTDEASRLAERAARWCEDRVSEGERLRHSLAVALYQAERWEEATALYEELAQEYPDDLRFKGSLGTLAARRGDHNEATRILDELLEIDDPYLHGANKYAGALIAAQIGDRERAVGLLSEAMTAGYEHCANAHYEMDLEPLWDYPPYKEFMRPKG
jgi:tetratricopeptide (TPR) repeat protein/predicted Ser/Thr protein kinase